MRAEKLDQWIRQKQNEVYVQIDPAWRGCDFEYPGWVKQFKGESLGIHIIDNWLFAVDDGFDVAGENGSNGVSGALGNLVV